MHRWLTAQGALAIVVLIAAGCASAKQNGGGGNQDFGGGGGGGGDDLGDADQGGGGGGGGADMRSGMCDPLAQSGCASGEKCTLGSGMATQCLPDGAKATGILCGASMTDDCVHKDICITETTTLNQCREMCAADTDCKQGAVGGVATNLGHCLITLTGASTKVCTVACQPAPAAGASGCATGLGCEVFGYMPTGSTQVYQGTDCAGPGAGTDGANCATNGNGDCAAGFGCISVGSASKCRRICRIVGGTPQNGDCVAGAPTCNTTTAATPAWGFCCPSGGC